MAQCVIRSRRAHRLVFAALSASTALLPGVAWAQCVNTPALPATTVSIECSGTAAAFTNTAASGVTVTVDGPVGSTAAASVSAPLVIGTASGATGNILNNNGSISGTGAAFTVQFGNGSTINNGSSSLHTASITASGTTNASGGILVGNDSTVNNYGTLTSIAGTSVVRFGSHGTFFNDATAPAAVTGNIIFGSTTGSATSTFTNNNTAFGLTGNVGATGNIVATNAGLWTGSFTQSNASGGTAVTFTNGTSSGDQSKIIFTGTVSSEGVTALTNYATMYLYQNALPNGGQAIIGSGQTGGSSVVNNGTMFIGSGTAAGLLTIEGDFTQTSTGTLNLIVLPSGVATATPGTHFSQIDAVGGTINLGTTVTTTSGSNAVTFSGTTPIVGQVVSGPGIPVGTTIASVTGSTGTLSANATTTGSGAVPLGGTLVMNITPGFYTTGANYQMLLADNGITGNFSSITGSALPFISFIPVGCTQAGGNDTCAQSTTKTTTTTITTAASGSTPAVTTTTTTLNSNLPIGTTTTTSGNITTTVTTTSTSVITPTGTAGIVTTSASSGTQQAYEFTVARTATYHDALVSAGVGSPASLVTTNQLAIATSLFPTLSNTGVASGLVKVANDAIAANKLTDDSITFVGEIDVLTISQAQTFLDSISPEGYLAYKTALHDQANAFTRSVALRMEDQNSSHDEDGWWFNMQGEYEMKSRADNSTGYRTKDDTLAFLAGYDFSGPHHVYGLALNLSWDSLSYAPGSLHGHNRDFAIAAYGAYDLGPLVFSGQIAYNMGHMSAGKTITLGSVTRTASGNAGEHLLKGTGTVGLNVINGDYKLQPFVGIEYANGKVSGFTETATTTTASNLTVDAMNANRTDLMAGVSFSRSTGVFRPYIRVAYRNQIGSGSGNTISAYFNADPTPTRFTVTGIAEARREIDANAGVNWVFDDAGALFVGAQATSRTAHTSVGLNIGIRLEF